MPELVRRNPVLEPDPVEPEIDSRVLARERKLHWALLLILSLNIMAVSGAVAFCALLRAG